MTHIEKIYEENIYLKDSIEEVILEVIEYQKYFSSEKFEGIENDFAHVRTDIYPKLQHLRNLLQNKLNNL